MKGRLKCYGRCIRRFFRDPTLEGYQGRTKPRKCKYAVGIDFACTFSCRCKDCTLIPAIKALSMTEAINEFLSPYKPLDIARPIRRNK